jgi:hypothetical protein
MICPQCDQYVYGAQHICRPPTGARGSDIMTNQPILANLGDNDPIEYGGYFVFDDHAELLVVPEFDEDGEILDTNDDARWIVYRFDLQRCTFIDGVLSDNPYHPDKSAWFAGTAAERAARPQDTTYLENIVEDTGVELEELIEAFCSDDPVERAEAYLRVADYHGYENFDSYPLTLTRAEVEERYHLQEVQ